MNSSEKVDSLEDTISQVFDEIHMNPNSSSEGSSKDDSGTEQGFIGKHLKKLKEQEELKKRKIEE